MSDVRVLQVALSLNPGGTERLVLELAGRLHPELPTAVCCLDEAGSWASQLTAQGIHVTALNRPSGFRPSLGAAIARVARDHRATVIHAHHYSSFVYGGLGRLWRPGLRLVFTEHGRLSDAPPSSKRLLANRLLRQLPHAVFTVSQDLKQHLVAEGFTHEQVGVIYNGIDVGPRAEASARGRMRQALGLAADAFVIGTVARLDPVKDLGCLIRAVQALRSAQPVVALIVGDGSERHALEELTAASGATERVRFLGHRDDARAVLAACDAYVNCSTSEGVSLTILEAMAAELPVVATRVGGTPEVVDDSCGRLIPARDPLALAASLSDLAAHDEARAALGSAGRRRVEARFTLTRMVSEYRAAYEQA